MTTTLTQTLGVAVAGASYAVRIPMAAAFILFGTVCIAFIRGVR